MFNVYIICMYKQQPICIGYLENIIQVIIDLLSPYTHPLLIKSVPSSLGCAALLDGSVRLTSIIQTNTESGVTITCYPIGQRNVYKMS